MNANMQKWIETLELPEMQDKQMRHYLGNTEGLRCCLGVACDLAVEAGVIPKPCVESSAEAEGHCVLAYGEAQSSTIYGLPFEVVKWLGFNPDGYRDIAFQQNLTELNDTGRTFKEIAQEIRNYAKHVSPGDPE